MQQQDPVQEKLGCLECPIKCSWNLLPSILALSILILFNFIGVDTISVCRVRVDVASIQQLLIWQLYLLFVCSGMNKPVLEYFKSKEMHNVAMLIGIGIACLSPIATFSLMFKFPDSCSAVLPAYFVTVYWIFSSMTMLFSFAFMYYALKPSFVEFSAKLSVRRLRKSIEAKDALLSMRFPRQLGVLCSPAKSPDTWKKCLLQEREISEQERLWKPWDYQHLVYFYSQRLYYHDLHVVNVTLQDVLQADLVCHICKSKFCQLDYAFIHPVILYISHADCLLKNPTGMNANFRYKFWQSLGERFRTEKQLLLHNRVEPGDNQPNTNSQAKTRFVLPPEEACPEFEFRLSLLINEVPEWLATLSKRIHNQLNVSLTKKPNETEDKVPEQLNKCH